jgi:hypothetical protein
MDSSEDRRSRDDQPLPTTLEIAFARQAARDRKLLEDALRAQPRLADSAEAIVEHLKREKSVASTTSLPPASPQEGSFYEQPNPTKVGKRRKPRLESTEFGVALLEKGGTRDEILQKVCPLIPGYQNMTSPQQSKAEDRAWKNILAVKRRIERS